MSEITGFAGRVLTTVRGLAGRSREARVRELELLETLVLGPKKQVQLVRCGDARFLVGSGAEGVQTIVRVDASGPEEAR